MVQRTRVGGGSSALGRTFAVGATAGPLLQGAAEITGTLQDQAIEEQKNKDLVTEVEDRGEFLRKVDEDISKLDPSQPDYAERVREAYDARRSETLEGTRISNEAVRNNLELGLTRLSEEAELRALQTSRESTQKRAVAALGDAENVMLSQIEEDPDGAGVFEEEFTAAFAAAGEAIPNQAAREAAFDEVMDRATLARARGFARQGRREEAEALLEKNAGMFTPAQRKAAERDIRVIDGEVRRARAVDNANAVADLEVAILNDQAGVEDVEAADKAGVFASNPRLKPVLLRQIQTRDRAKLAGIEKDLDILQRFENGEGLKNRAEAETVWESRVQELGPDAQPRQLMDEAANITLRAGAVPESIFRLTRAANASNDPAQVAAGIMFHGAIVAKSPTADTGANKRIQAGSAMMRVLGVDAGTAATLLTENEPTGPVRKERTEIFDTELGFDSADFLGRIGFDEDRLPPGLQGGARQMVREFYAQTGSLEVAEAAVQDLMKRQYGQTQVMGRNETVRFPPESYALPGNMVGPGVDGAARRQIVEELVQDFLDERGLKPAQTLAETRGEVDQGAGFVASEVGLGPEAAARQELLVPAFRLTYIQGTNPPQYEIGLLNEFASVESPTYSRVGVFRGATEEEAKATEAWKGWVSRQSNIAAQEEARARRLDRFMRENEELNIEAPGP